MPGVKPEDRKKKIPEIKSTISMSVIKDLIFYILWKLKIKKLKN